MPSKQSREFVEKIINQAADLAASFCLNVPHNQTGFLVLGIALELAIETWLDMANVADYDITVIEFKVLTMDLLGKLEAALLVEEKAVIN